LLTIHNINSLEQYKNYSGELFGLNSKPPEEIDKEKTSIAFIRGKKNKK